MSACSARASRRFPPALAAGRQSERRIRRLPRGEPPTRSDLGPDVLSAKLQAHGGERLRGEPSLWGILDGADLRKPHATAMGSLPRVTRLPGRGTVPGYRTLNAIGSAPDRRGLLSHRRFSSPAPDCVSESEETPTAIRSVAGALAPWGADVTWMLDAGCDDVALGSAIWAQETRLLCRLQHRERWVATRAGERRQVADLAPRLRPLAPRLRPLAPVSAELVVQKTGQPRPRLPPVTGTVAATPLVVRWAAGLRTPAEGEAQTKPCWLGEVRLQRVAQERWWLLTDRPVETAEQATGSVRMDRQRWAIADACKVAKPCLGWEDVQVLAYEAVRVLVALGWVAAGFLCDLGVSLAWDEVRRLRRLGGGEARPHRPPGKLVLTRG